MKLNDYLKQTNHTSALELSNDELKEWFEKHCDDERLSGKFSFFIEKEKILKFDSSTCWNNIRKALYYNKKFSLCYVESEGCFYDKQGVIEHGDYIAIDIID